MDPEIVFGEISALAFGGQGILRHEGLVIFVPFTAPGDQVKVQITHKRKSFAEAVLVELIAPGRERRPAPCPYFGICGGCQIQQLNEKEQLRQKRQFVIDALQRIGKLRLPDKIPIIPATSWAYRRHIKLTLALNAGVYEAGYVRWDLTGVVSINQCPIFLDATNPLLRDVQQLVSQLTPALGEGAHLTIIKSTASQYVLAFEFPDRLPSNLEEVLKRWLQTHAEIAGALVQGDESLSTYGHTFGAFEVEGLQIVFSPLAFVQCHPEQSLNVYQEIARLAKGCGAKSVLDLYCGIGITSLLLARIGCAVTGVEGHPEAVQMAISNAKKNAISEARFVRADVARVLPSLLQQTAPDLVVLNPPRTGLDPKTRASLLEKPPQNLIYISCMPATLARDLSALCEHGFTITSCQVYDMFPQTTHVETVVFLQKKSTT